MCVAEGRADRGGDDRAGARGSRAEATERNAFGLKAIFSVSLTLPSAGEGLGRGQALQVRRAWRSSDPPHPKLLFPRGDGGGEGILKKRGGVDSKDSARRSRGWGRLSPYRLELFFVEEVALAAEVAGDLRLALFEDHRRNSRAPSKRSCTRRRGRANTAVKAEPREDRGAVATAAGRRAPHGARPHAHRPSRRARSTKSPARRRSPAPATIPRPRCPAAPAPGPRPKSRWRPLPRPRSRRVHQQRVARERAVDLLALDQIVLDVLVDPAARHSGLAPERFAHAQIAYHVDDAASRLRPPRPRLNRSALWWSARAAGAAARLGFLR